MRDRWDLPDDELDGLFKDAADKLKPRFNPEAWKRMEAKLDDHQPKPPPILGKWLKRTLLAGVLLLLSGLVFWFSTPTTQNPIVPIGKVNTLTKTSPNNLPQTPQLGSKDKIEKIDPSKESQQKVEAIPTKQHHPRNPHGSALDFNPTELASTSRPVHSDKSNLDALKPNINPAKELVKPTTTENTAWIPEKPTETTEPNEVSSSNKVAPRLHNHFPAQNSKYEPLAANNLKAKNNPKPTYLRKSVKQELAKSTSVNLSGNRKETSLNNTTRTPYATEMKASALPTPQQTQVDKIPARQVTLSRAGFGLPSVLRVLAQSEAMPQKPVVVTRPKWGLRVLMAPDANTVGTTNPFAVGASYGAMLEYQLGSKVRLQTGATYSKKSYTSNLESYHSPYGFWVYGIKPEQITADCRILDIPLNIRWDAVRRLKYDLFFNTGLSSYLMLNERYDYQYDTKYDTNTHIIRKWEKARNSDHFFSTLNLSIGYERQLKHGFTVQIEPYFKLPLKGVGFASVDIYSTGLIISTKYQFRTNQR